MINELYIGICLKVVGDSLSFGCHFISVVFTAVVGRNCRKLSLCDCANRCVE